MLHAKEAVTTAVEERRRSRRMELCVPVTVTCPDTVIEGYSQDLNYLGVLVQSLTGLPQPKEECEVVLEFPLGGVRARGRVVRVQAEERMFAVELTHMELNGHVLLAAMLTAGTDPARDFGK